MSAFRSPTFVGQALLLAVLVLLGLARVRQAHSAETTPFGGFTAEQIRVRSEQFCRLLAPPAHGLQIAVEPNHRMGHDAVLRACWTAEATDRAGNLVARLFWDANSGELLLAHCGGPPNPRTGPSLSRDRAVAFSQEWLCLLEVAGCETGWRMLGEPERNGERWKIRWEREGRTVAILINARSGALRSFTRG